MAVGPAHTVSDTVLRLPADGILLSGDLVVNDREPVLLSGASQPWLDWLDETLRGPDVTILPGHGPLCGRSEVQAVRDYIGWLVDAVRSALAAGAPVESLREVTLPEQFRGGSPSHSAYRANLQFLYSQLSAAPR